MSAVDRALAIVAVLALAGCGGAAPDEGNVVITNEVPPDAEIETLPPDESVAAESEELATGVNEPDANETATNAD